MTITTGKYVGHTGTVESNVYQKTVDHLDEWANGYHVMLDTEELVTVRWDQLTLYIPAGGFSENKLESETTQDSI